MGAGHDHGGADARVSRMVIAAAILSGFFVLELTTALLINSIALLADAGHMLTDLVAMFMGLTAVLLARHGSASPATDLRLAPRRGVHRGRQRGAADRSSRLHPLRGVRAARRRARRARRADDRRRAGGPGGQRHRRAAAALALRRQPRGQGRLHGGRRRHRRQHRRADRGHRHGHHAAGRTPTSWSRSSSRCGCCRARSRSRGRRCASCPSPRPPTSTSRSCGPRCARSTA